MTQFEFELVAFTVDDTTIPQRHGGVAVQDLQDENVFSDNASKPRIVLLP